MINLKYVIIILFPLFSFGQDILDSNSDKNNSISVYVYSKSKILLNGNKTSIPKLDKYLRNNRVNQAKIGTLKPTPQKVFPIFEKVVNLMKKYNIKTEWYSDSDFQKPFFDEEKKN
ncbi:hypothetical protein [Tamlana sp. I1]|uniref:hypothetical protein n=1 Tax=Tamlana sp. I1 TaxID=2762061 RepID=UPI00188EAEA6|nr:hypothetical protein [Tamlana sp. I1]